MYIESSNVAQGNALDSKDSADRGYLNLMDTIPLTAPFGCILSYVTNDLLSSEIDYQKAQSIRRIRIRVSDSHGNTLTFPPTSELDFVFKFWFLPN